MSPRALANLFLIAVFVVGGMIAFLLLSRWMFGSASPDWIVGALALWLFVLLAVGIGTAVYHERNLPGEFDRLRRRGLLRAQTLRPRRALVLRSLDENDEDNSETRSYFLELEKDGDVLYLNDWEGVEPNQEIIKTSGSRNADVGNGPFPNEHSILWRHRKHNYIVCVENLGEPLKAVTILRVSDDRVLHNSLAPELGEIVRGKTFDQLLRLFTTDADR